MKMFVIEREIPDVNKLNAEQLRGAAKKSNEALRQLAPDIQWNHSYVVDNKTFCIYLATDASFVAKHAELSGFPANKVSEVHRIIAPTTARAV